MRLKNKFIKNLITREQPKSPISEQYRTLRTNIEFSMINQNLKTLILTSAIPREGKSLTASNLAVTFADQGRKVLFIDADLRKPTIHHYFEIENLNGLTNVLTKRVDLTEAMFLTEVDNLWVLPSGPIPPNPAELLGSEAMRELVAITSKMFDIVIFDAPPVLAVTDAQVLGRICDGALLVVKSQANESKSLKKAKDLLGKAYVNIIGVVLNDVDQKEANHYYY